MDIRKNQLSHLFPEDLFTKNSDSKQMIVTFTAKDGTHVTLRPAVTKDAKDITRSVQSIIESGEFIQKENPRSLEEEHAFIRQMDEDGNMYTAVEISGRVVGIARVIRGELEMKQHTGVFRIWLSKDGQGKGVGTKIMEYTLNWGKEAGIHKLWLTVFSGNEPAYKLYERFGFVTEGIQKNQACIHGAFQDEIYMAYFFNDKLHC
jgi:RimJ/RimL family protein N-acetyltransferase